MVKNDPRIFRTRKLIVDSFISLASEKDFNAITVSDITKKAMINRATFYAHFDDKFDLLDSTITNTFTDKLKKGLNGHEGFNEKTIANIFMTMCDHHKELSELCPKGYESLGNIIENKIKAELQKQIANLILQGTKNAVLLKKQQLVTTISTMLSWSFYGITYKWNKDGRPIPAEKLATQTLTIFENGIDKYFY